MFGNIQTIFASPCGSVPASKETPTVSHSIPLRRLWWAAILLLSLAATSVGWTVWQLRNEAIRAAVSETGNIAIVLAGQISRSIQAIDTVLEEIKKSANGKEIAFSTGAGTAAANRA
jgi:hypothetical protein